MILSWYVRILLFFFFLIVVVGLFYFCIDSYFGEFYKFKREWVSVMRCVVVFVGINYVSVVFFSGCVVCRVFFWVMC